MSKPVSAMPYAKALFDVAKTTGRTAEIGEELAAFTALVGSHAELARVLSHPAIPPKAKRAIVERLARESSLSAPLEQLLGLLADRDRLDVLPRLHKAYHARLLQHQGVVEAHVTTAVPLAEDRSTALAEGLALATGKDVRVTTAVDPALMGGVVARLGSKVFDGSVRRQLERLRERLAQA